MEKYFNNALVGNSNILATITNKGELIRLYYPNIDYFQNIDMYNVISFILSYFIAALGDIPT